MSEIKVRCYELITNTKQDFVAYKDQDYMGDSVNEPHKLRYVRFTGLRDKNGNEIYEGDILKEFGATTLSIVEWQDNIAAYRGLNKSYCSQVIGNIYQNPELLKETK